MSARETILQTIRPVAGQGPSRLPLALLSAGTWTFQQQGLELQDVLANPEVAAPAIAAVNAQVGSDILWPGSGYNNLPVQALGGRLKFRSRGNIDVLAPAFGSLGELEQADLDALDAHPWVGAIRRVIREVAAQSGAEYLVGTSVWGPFTLAGQLYGVEKLLGGLYKDQEGIHALLALAAEVCYRYLAPTLAEGALLLSIAEPTASGDLISLRHFEEFVAPYLQQLIRRLKDDGALITLHICGNIQDRLGLAPALGVDLLSVDFKVNLARAAAELQGRTALAGNLNPVLLRAGSEAEVFRATRDILAEAADLPRFVLMPGCDLPAAVPLANVQAFFNAGRQWPGR